MDRIRSLLQFFSHFMYYVRSHDRRSMPIRYIVTFPSRDPEHLAERSDLSFRDKSHPILYLFQFGF